MNAMTYLLGTYWLWMIIALVIGGVVGFTTFDRAARSWWPERWPGWLKLAGLVFVAGLVLAPLKLLPGRAGLLLETALFLFPCYIVGCLLGSWLASLRVPEAPVLAVPAGPSLAPEPVMPRPAPVIPAAPAILPSVAPPVTAPPSLTAGPDGPADDLKLIRGIGPKNEAALNGLAVHRFAQIAQWQAPETEWVGQHLAFPGRIEREEWVPQAQLLAAGIPTDYATAIASGQLVPDDAAVSELDLGDLKASLAKAASATLAASTAAVAPVVDAVKAPFAGITGAPPSLTAGPDGPADDLKLIRGIGPKNEAALNGLGVHRFAQIAQWQAPETEWVGQHLAFPGRIEREEWVPQARLLAGGIETDYATAVRTGARAAGDEALSDADVAQLQAWMPSAALPIEDGVERAGSRPPGLLAAIGGKADDLKRISGIGRQNEARLNTLGIWHFHQIAAWTESQVDWVGDYLHFPGRITREGWVDQASKLARGIETEFSRRVDEGLVPTSGDGDEPS